MPTISASIDMEMDALLEAESQNTGLSKSSLIRKYIKSGVSGTKEPEQTQQFRARAPIEPEYKEEKEEVIEPKEPIKTEEEIEKENEEKERKEWRKVEEIADRHLEQYAKNLKNQQSGNEIKDLILKLNREHEELKLRFNETEPKLQKISEIDRLKKEHAYKISRLEKEHEDLKVVCSKLIEAVGK